jgi:hypothetical protein
MAGLNKETAMLHGNTICYGYNSEERQQPLITVLSTIYKLSQDFNSSFNFIYPIHLGYQLLHPGGHEVLGWLNVQILIDRRNDHREERLPQLCQKRLKDFETLICELNPQLRKEPMSESKVIHWLARFVADRQHERYDNQAIRITYERPKIGKALENVVRTIGIPGNIVCDSDEMQNNPHALAQWLINQSIILLKLDQDNFYDCFATLIEKCKKLVQSN